MMRVPYSLFAIAALLLLIVAPVFAQTEGPLTAPPKFEVKEISPTPPSATPPIPLPQLLQQVAKNEDAIRQAYTGYTFDQSTRVQELPAPGVPGGEFSAEGEVYRKPDGERYERVLKPPVSTLKRTIFEIPDVEKFVSLPFFILTTAELPHYNVTFEGDEKLDEIHAYILRVQPKQMERMTHRFNGVVWVDDHDMAIVKSYGRFITDVAQSETLQEPFVDFEIYRENITGHLWFPTYVRSDSVIAQKDGDLHLRLIMRSTNFQLSTPASPPAASSTQRPVAPAVALPTAGAAPPAKP
jgi:hypothetical protein